MRISIVRGEEAPAPEPDDGKAVAQVIHYVTRRGTVVGVKVEPFGDGSTDEVAQAAYNAGKRLPPFDDPAPRNVAAALVKQISAVLATAGEVIAEIEQSTPYQANENHYFRQGWRTCAAKLLDSDNLYLLRERITDARPLLQEMSAQLRKFNPKPPTT
ncbi:MAG TPA: hypothetical protein VGN72_04320 [Tepidisphaeraceae bacterium]|jgi:hypothetical protein|nr:hypothetical protein [Tepidisphaeraceae bacterium]